MCQLAGIALTAIDERVPRIRRENRVAALHALIGLATR
jgi:hypothetical protein